MNDIPAYKIQIPLTPTQIFVLAVKRPNRPLCGPYIKARQILAVDGISVKYPSIYPTWGTLGFGSEFEAFPDC